MSLLKSISTQINFSISWPPASVEGLWRVNSTAQGYVGLDAGSEINNSLGALERSCSGANSSAVTSAEESCSSVSTETCFTHLELNKCLLLKWRQAQAYRCIRCTCWEYLGWIDDQTPCSLIIWDYRDSETAKDSQDPARGHLINWAYLFALKTNDIRNASMAAHLASLWSWLQLLLKRN